jgi:hypothetical protein
MARQLRRWWAAPLLSPRIPLAERDRIFGNSPHQTEPIGVHPTTPRRPQSPIAAAFTALSTSPPQEGIHLEEPGGSLTRCSRLPTAYTRSSIPLSAAAERRR